MRAALHVGARVAGAGLDEPDVPRAPLVACTLHRTCSGALDALTRAPSAHEVRGGGMSALSVVLAVAAGVNGAGIESALGAFRESKPIVDVRMRAESVEQDGMAQEADALTLRGRLGFETAKAWSTSLLAETELLWPLQDDYNSTTNGKTPYPVIADPESYEINRLQLTNTSLANTTITLGRQRINLDDQRFVGSVGWRQNEQTFDALRVIVRPTPKLTVDLVYADQVNRVFGRQAPLTPGSPAGRYHGDNYLVNAAYQTPLGRIALFAYLLDFQEPQGIRDSSRTMGLRFSGERPSGPVGLAYALSYATQEDYADNPFSYEEDFYAVEVTGTFRQLVAGIGYEVLDGDGAKGFTTPLATLHRFDGWADKFLVTPPNGLERRYATLGYAMKGVGLIETLSATAVYHEFDSSRGRLDYGSELDLQVQAKWRRFSGLLKYADYRADGFATDTTKYWVQIEFIW
jgi:hypothetical protein